MLKVTRCNAQSWLIKGCNLIKQIAYYINYTTTTDVTIWEGLNESLVNPNYQICILSTSVLTLTYFNVHVDLLAESVLQVMGTDRHIPMITLDHLQHLERPLLDLHQTGIQGELRTLIICHMLHV